MPGGWPRARRRSRRAPERWHPRGTVLITGGTGALGAHTARWLARRGARRILLAGRLGERAAGAAELIEELRGLGAAATAVSCDVTDRAAVAELLASVPRDAPLSAVVHAAGALDVRSLADTTIDDLVEATAAKVAGAHHLDALLADTPLDAFVLFSSNAGVWGSGNQAAYGAGNAYLDALAQQRRGRGLAATSIAWGAWDGDGMVSADIRRYLERHGVLPMDPERAVEALGDAVEHGDTVVTIADVDWERFVPAFTSARPSPLLAHLAPAPGSPEREENAPAGAAEPGGTGLARALAGMPAADRRGWTLDLVRSHIAAVLGFAARTPSARTRPSANSGSTRSPRWNCATGWPRPPA
ncbi:beta-ketoacyl reductase [Actinomadura madurae]|uniref:beta-ketoacyl reductase n=1 Tax=Actinomadura madurae TaxID=1993 RepID=UPI0020D22820|nr:beta-ketoacyl reductase [Actinomadura madurae]MCP9972483.1 beta-ketoacyl reductase [Actinomadura madurae]